MTKHYSLLIFFSFISLAGFSQDGELDMSFNTPVHLNASTSNGFEDENNAAFICSSKMLPNGKLIVFGSFDTYQGDTIHKMAVLNTNGILDTSFNTGTGPDEDFINPGPEMIDVQPDGKIIVVGDFLSFNGTAVTRMVRLNANGTIDVSFNPGSSANSHIRCVRVLGNGKILCGGNFTTFNGQNKKGIVMLNADGSIDETFNIGTGFTNMLNVFNEPADIFTIDVQDDNKILLGGNFDHYNDFAKFGLVRINANGNYDPDFTGSGAGTNVNGSNNGTITKILYDAATEKIYISGSIPTYNGTASKNVLRLNMDGTVDTSFNFDNVMSFNNNWTHKFVFDIKLLSNGKLIAGGEFVLPTCENVAVFNNDGTIDSSFNTLVRHGHTKVASIIVNGDNIYIAGEFEIVTGRFNNKGSIAKLHYNGSTDISFNPNLGANLGGQCISALELTNGNIIVSSIAVNSFPEGTIQATYNEKPATSSIKINPDGSIHEEDYDNFLQLGILGKKMAYDNNGEILICNGLFTRRIFENGLLDASFTSSSDIISYANNPLTNDLAVQTDNKIVMAGTFMYDVNVPPYHRQRIMRVNSDGSLDRSYNVNGGFDGDGDYFQSVNALAMQPDDKVVAVGSFTDYNNVPANNIIRLNTDATVDSTFVYGTGFNKNVKNLKYLDSGKYIICGNFTQYNGSDANYIVRLNNDGSVDTSFTSPYALSDEPANISTVLVQPDGKYLIVGIINSVEFINRLNTDGTLDSTFYNDNTFTYFSL